MKFKLVLLITILGIGAWIFLGQSNQVRAQPRITNTPVNVVIPEITATEPPQSSNNGFIASPSPTFTATQPLPNARLVSIAATGTALIRDFPEDGTILGVLQDNTDYQILGQYFSWYQIQLAIAPQGVAWVYYEDVRVSGDLASIPPINPNAQPAQFSAQDIATATALALFQTPGFAETATAESRVLEIPEEEIAAAGSTSQFPLTYTPPADIVVLQATAIPNVQATSIAEINILDSTIQSVASGDIPPLLTILGLGILGVLGMLIASVRR